jgi:pyruvate,orthophosphate dikinase
MSHKYVYLFEEGRAEMKSLLGGKGANLAEMTRIGLPVPPGFTISTEACNAFSSSGGQMPDGLDAQVSAALRTLEDKTGRKLGELATPLLVSVRSGAAVSMPGMMDTVLNLGLNDQTVVAHAQGTQNPRFAWDCYRRFVQMFANVVLSLPMHEFERALHAARLNQGVQSDAELTAESLQALVRTFQRLVHELSGQPFPQDPHAQLQAAIRAVFESWNNPRATIYRKVHKISDTLGTAVNVQAMAFGNMGNDSATGVAFTRNPNTGEKEFYGEYLLNAQGEDVVAGIRTPFPIAQLRSELPEAYDQLYQTCELLEAHYRDMQDIEFTIERGRLYMLQCRVGKRTAQAAIRIAVDLVAEGKITREQALVRVEPGQVETLLHPRFDPHAKVEVLATGLPASPGAASGEVAFDPDEAEHLRAAGKKVILIRPETTPDDIHGMIASEGVLTTRGGMTCHAAIVARGMGKPCIVGCDALRIDMGHKSARVGDILIQAGDLVSIDGATGRLLKGAVPLVDAALAPEVQQLLGWADDVRQLRVRANADSPHDASKARSFGAEGIGLCRTEHMFGQGGFHPERMAVVQEMILAETLEDRQAALDQLAPMQEQDFVGILRAMAPYPVTIRLLDPPLHEFMPGEKDLAAIEATDPLRAAAMRRKIHALEEVNPMLGLRGVRLGIVYPEIYEMQIRAILKAGQRLHLEGVACKPEIMIPLVGHPSELARMQALIQAVHAELKPSFAYPVGTMIELPRAALVADEIAQTAEFFSFGTNDLTQTTFGYSRDDAEARFLGHYLQEKVLAENPFVTLDRKGVGKLVQMAAELGRSVRPDIKLGICGEHGGEAQSIEFCHQIGLSYVSCSPFRVPVARLAAGQAAVRARGVQATTSAV